MERRECRAADATRASSVPEASTSIATSERFDDALHVSAALAGVLNQVQVFVFANLLDPDEHFLERLADRPKQSTTESVIRSSPDVDNLPIF
jgi:hypothetical protein